ncbi:sporulation protein YtxC [Brevibacillus sp. SYSU BS000544]|uniref:sporulation protein YtxC n=1 Tax=Brevibacillus sp. SYSU BS000544 TaxID=3416443 RepID=UPI003CE51E1B
MQTLSVLLQKDKPASHRSFRMFVDKYRQLIPISPITIEIREEENTRSYVYTFVSWSAEEYTLETRDVVRSFVSLILVDWLIETMQPLMAKQFLRRDVAPELVSEWDLVYPYIQTVLLENEMMSNAGSLKLVLYDLLMDYFQESNDIVVQGFVQFRMKSYLEALYDAVELGVDRYLEEKEYREFVELLRYFVSIQETRYELVHVVGGGTKPLSFFDENGDSISMEQLEMILHSVGQEFREEDYLVSALITLAPKRILFHAANQKSTLKDTLYSIFDDRLSVCDSCAYCLNTKRALDFTKSSLYNT